MHPDGNRIKKSSQPVDARGMTKVAFLKRPLFNKGQIMAVASWLQLSGHLLLP
jgi:hypothetical protein